jgi:FtsH-binding integral membrane protein
MEKENAERWSVLGRRMPKSEIVYFFQMLVVFIIIITSIVNLSLQNGQKELWLTLLSSAIGYALPSPTITDPK